MTSLHRARRAAGRTPALAQGKLNVVATTEDLASIGREVGGDRITIESIAKGYQDPHFVEAKPSFILKLQRADLLIAVGRELEIGWLPPLIQQSRNGKIQPGAAGLSRCLARRGDSGDPDRADHPRDGRRPSARQPALLARSRRTASASPSRSRTSCRSCGRTTAPSSSSSWPSFTARLDAAEKRWLAMMAPYKGTKIVTYHRSFPNFAERFGLDIVGYVEPRPGIPPTPQHTLDLINEMKRQNVKLVLVEPYFDSKTPNAIGRETGAQVLVMPPSVGGTKDVGDYFKLFDYDIALLVEAIQEESE